MVKHDFTGLKKEYPNIIRKMKPTFLAHEFILSLAKFNQSEYVEALYAYRGKEPFRLVHKRLAEMLHEFPQLVTKDGIAKSTETQDIFRAAQTCTRWKKV